METFAYCDVKFVVSPTWNDIRNDFAEKIQKFIGNGATADYLEYVTSLEDLHVTILFSFNHNERSMKFMNDLGIEGEGEYSFLNDVSHLFRDMYFAPTNFEGFSKRNIFVMTGDFVPNVPDNGEFDLNYVRSETSKMMRNIIEAGYEYEPDVVRNRILTLLHNVPKADIFNALSVILRIIVRSLGGDMGDPYIPHCTIVQSERLFKSIVGSEKDMHNYPEFYNGIFQALSSFPIERIKTIDMIVDKMTMETW